MESGRRSREKKRTKKVIEQDIYWRHNEDNPGWNGE